MLGWILVFVAVVALLAEPNVGVLVAVAAAVLWYLLYGREEEDAAEPVPRDRPDGTGFPLEQGARRVLRWIESRSGSGFVLEDAATAERVPPGRLDGSEGVFAVEVASGEHRERALQDPSFGPGREVRVVLEPDNPVDPDAVAVWNLDEDLQAGYLPEGAPEKREIGALLRDDVELRAFVAWQELDEGDRRRGLELLVLEPGVAFARAD